MKLKRLLTSLSLVVMSLSVLAPQLADAKRLGGGGTSGMRRDIPARSTPSTPPQNQQAPAAAATTPPAAAAPAAPKRSWMGPIAGLAAGLGIAALMSHLGMGAGFSNFIMIVLLALVAFLVIRFLMRRFGPRPAASGMRFAGAGGEAGYLPSARPVEFRGGSVGGSTQATATPPLTLPPGFDAPAFERSAKLIFLRMQAANDAADLNDLRAFTTPEMFAAVKLDLQERPPGQQHTDVVQLDAEVVDVAQDAQQQIVSVRFHGQIREEARGAIEPLDEVWHLVRPHDGSREWAIAGIAPYA